MFGLLAMVAVAAAPDPESPCGPPIKNEWVKSPSPPFQETPKIDESRIHPVTAHIDKAIDRLSKSAVIRLKRSDIPYFLGPIAGAPGESYGRSKDKVRPYLVRAVFPSPAPYLDVRWNRNSLDIFAGGLGCPSFSKHPLIIYLDMKPTDIFIETSSAL